MVTFKPRRFDEPTERIAADTVSSGSRVLMAAPPSPAAWARHQSTAVGAPGSALRPAACRVRTFHGVSNEVTSRRRTPLMYACRSTLFATPTNTGLFAGTSARISTSTFFHEITVGAVTTATPSASTG